MSLPIALQLYTVRDLMAEDLEGTLKAVARLGFRYVELAGLFDHSAQDVKKILDSLEITPISAHERVTDNPQAIQAIIERANVLGYRYVMSGLPDNTMRSSAQGYRQALDELRRCAARLSEASLTYGYHHHAFEFDLLDDGQRGMDILFGSPELYAELDVYWVQRGGDDPLAWMNHLAGRIALLHVKDMDNTPDQHFTEVGTGIIDMPAVVELAPKVGVQYLVIEQDRNWKDDDPLHSAAISLENLQKIAN